MENTTENSSNVIKNLKNFTIPHLRTPMKGYQVSEIRTELKNITEYIEKYHLYLNAFDKVNK